MCSERLFCIPLLFCMAICITLTFLSASTSLAVLLRPLSLTTQVFACRTAAHCFFRTILCSLESAVHENPRRSAISEILKPACLAPTIIPRSKSLRSHFFPFLILVRFFRLSAFFLLDHMHDNLTCSACRLC